MKFRRGIRRLVSIFAVISLLSSSVAFSAPSEDQTINYQLSAQAAAGDLEQPSERDASEFSSNIESWADQQKELLPILFDQAVKLEEKANELSATMGEEYLDEQIRKNIFQISEEAYGLKAEYRIISSDDGLHQYRVPRILIHERAYILIDEKLIPRNSKHLRQYIARVNHESGSGRPKLGVNGEVEKNIFGQDKKTSGRDLTVVYVNDDVTDVVKEYKSKPTEWRWWSTYFVSKWKNPTIEDFSMSLVTGVLMQGGLTFGATLLKSHVLGTEFSMDPTYWSMGYGLAIGTLISSYRNWTVNSGSRLTRILKSQVVSALYAYGLVVSVHSGDLGDRLAAVSMLTGEGQAKNTSINANGLMNNLAKDYWSEITRQRERTRESGGNISFKIPFTNKTVEWRRASLESQMMYLIPWTINVISLLTLANTDLFQIPGTGITFPIFQLAGIPIAMQWNKWYARHLANKFKKNHPEMDTFNRELEAAAQRHQAAWDKSFGMNVKDIPGRVVEGSKAVGRGLVRGVKATVSGCSNLFSVVKDKVRNRAEDNR